MTTVRLGFALAGIIAFPAFSVAGSADRVFTYQGQLKQIGLPANGEFDMGFHLIDDPGTFLAGPICRDNVLATNGLFTPDFPGGVIVLA